MTRLTEGLLRGPSFNPEEANMEAIRRYAEEGAALPEDRWADHHIGTPSQARPQPQAAPTIPPSPFAGFLLELQGLVDEGGLEGEEGRTELELSLYYLDRISGQEKAKLCTKHRLSPDQCVRHGMPDLEGLALDYATMAGPWGDYRWNIKGWIKGDQVLSTSAKISLLQPAEWKPSVKEEPAAVPPAPTPFDSLKETLALGRLMRESLGLSGGEGASATTIKTAEMAAEMRARFEMEQAHGRSLREVQESHAREIRALQELLQKERDTARERITALEAQLREKEYELRSVPVSEEMGPLGLFIQKLDPNAVNGMLGAIAGKLMQSGTKAPAKPPARTKAATPPVATLAAPLEPTRAQVVQAVNLLRDAAQLAEHPDISERMEAFAKEGMAEGSLASWWVRVTSPADPTQPQGPSWLDFAAHLATQDDTPEEEEPMDFDALKTQLIQRLNEGATDEEILSEIEELFSPSQVDQARSMLRMAPAAMLGGMLGAPQHQSRLEILRSAMLAE
jgi:hypothetical protein